MGELSAEAVTKLLCTLPGIEQGLSDSPFSDANAGKVHNRVC